MTYAIHIPPPPLDAYIDDLYYVDGPPPYSRLKIFPMPSLHLMANFGHAFQVHQPDHTEPYATCTESWWVGSWSTYHIVNWPRNVQFFGVHFKPHGVYPFLHLPLSELHNQVVPLNAIWGHRAAEMREQLYAAPTLQAGFALLERFLLARLWDAPRGFDVVHYAVAEIARQNGALSIRGLSEHIGISENHLATHFKRIIGIPPKELARFYRFARALHLIILTQSVNWARIARQSSFYDQSHFIKEFLVFTGHTPTDYLRLRRHLHSQNPEQAKSLGQMPID